MMTDTQSANLSNAMFKAVCAAADVTVSLTYYEDL